MWKQVSPPLTPPLTLIIALSLTRSLALTVALEVLGDLGVPAAQQLAMAMADPNVKVRKHVAWALGAMKEGAAPAVGTLIEASPSHTFMALDTTDMGHFTVLDSTN